MNFGSFAKLAALASAAVLTACGGGGSSSGVDLELTFSYTPQTVGLWGDVSDVPNISGLEGHAPHCEVAGGALAQGLTLDSKTCAISGHPNEVGDFVATIRLTVSGFDGHVDATYVSGAVALQPTYRYEIGSNTAGWAFDFADEPTIDWYSRQPDDVVVYEYLGGLPNGLSFDPSTGNIHGIPGESGTFHPLIRLTITRDGRTYQSSEQGQPLVVFAPVDEIEYRATTMTVGESYQLSPSVGNSRLGVFYDDYVYELHSLTGCPGVLPSGWTMRSYNGLVSGTATAGMNQCVGVRLKVQQNGLVMNYDMRLQLTSQ